MKYVIPTIIFIILSVSVFSAPFGTGTFGLGTFGIGEAEEEESGGGGGGGDSTPEPEIDAPAPDEEKAKTGLGFMKYVLYVVVFLAIDFVIIVGVKLDRKRRKARKQNT